MANKLHNEWLAGKKALEDEIARFKAGKTNLKVGPLEELLKKFDQGFGPKLEDIGKAYKANNGAEVVKQANKALVIAQGYKALMKAPGGIDEGRAQAYKKANIQIDAVIKDLTGLSTKGMTGPNPN
jgi:hypothetical protein